MKFHLVVLEKKSKISQPIKGWVATLFFLNGPIYPNLVEDLELLLPVNLQLIPLSGFREELSQNVSANQRPWPPPYFSDQPKNTNFMEDIQFLLAIKFRQNTFSCFREEVKKLTKD